MFFSVQTSSRRATVLSLGDFFLLIELSLIRFNNCSLVLKIALAASLDKSLNSSVLSVSNNCVRLSGDLTLLKRVSYACSISGDVDILKERARHVRNEVFSSKDKRGLTPLHKVNERQTVETEKCLSHEK